MRFILTTLEQGRMPSRNTNLTTEQQRRKEDSLRLKILRGQIKAGTDGLGRGEFTEVDGADLGDYLKRLTTPAVRGAR